MRKSLLFALAVTEHVGDEVREAQVVITRKIAGKADRVISIEVKQDFAPNYVVVGNLKWAKGNLVSTGNNTCKIGKATDYGLYFTFGSLVGWTGGATGDGTGVVNASLALAVQVQPVGYGGTTEWTTAGRYLDGTTDDKGYNYPATDASTGIGDPCRYYLGGKWRTPTAAEYLPLMGPDGANTDKKAPLKVNNYELYFPGSGNRHMTGGALSSVDEGVTYWSSSTKFDQDYGYVLSCFGGYLKPQDKAPRALGLPVRCVAPAS